MLNINFLIFSKKLFNFSGNCINLINSFTKIKEDSDKLVGFIHSYKISHSTNSPLVCTNSSKRFEEECGKFKDQYHIDKLILETFMRMTGNLGEANSIFLSELQTMKITSIILVLCVAISTINLLINLKIGIIYIDIISICVISISNSAYWMLRITRESLSLYMHTLLKDHLSVTNLMIEYKLLSKEEILDLQRIEIVKINKK